MVQHCYKQIHTNTIVTTAPLYARNFRKNTMPPTSPPSTAAVKVILDSISDGVFTVDHGFRITSFNKAAEKITGFTREEAFGKHCWEIFGSNMCNADCALKKTMREGRSCMSNTTHITTAQGNTIPISLSTSLLKDEDGNILGGVETFRDTSEIEELRQELAGTVSIGRMVSRNPAMKQIFIILQQLAQSDTTALIEGETGTGKELLCRAIHTSSPRKNKKFVAINCGALPDTLLESELFGYKAGAFTGANTDKQGLFASAGDGTILLDEIGDTSPAFQVKLLRLLEEKEYQPLGSVDTITTTARIIAATNKNLADMVTSGAFRQDLYYRINVFHLKVPPLRQRPEDIPLLVERFIAKMNSIKDCNIQGIAPDALALLMSHNYPGNIRELENIIEHAFVVCRRGTIGKSHLPPELFEESPRSAPPSTSREEPTNLEEVVHSTERQVIIETLEQNKYSRKATAQKLGMHKTTLYRKMKKLGIKLPEQDGRSNIAEGAKGSS